MKGIIEVTPIVWIPSSDSENPFDGEYMAADKPIMIGISSITLIDGNSIHTNIDLQSSAGTSCFGIRTKESYEEIKKAIISSS